MKVRVPPSSLLPDLDCMRPIAFSTLVGAAPPPADAAPASLRCVFLPLLLPFLSSAFLGDDDAGLRWTLWPDPFAPFLSSSFFVGMDEVGLRCPLWPDSLAPFLSSSFLGAAS